MLAHSESIDSYRLSRMNLAHLRPIQFAMSRAIREKTKVVESSGIGLQRCPAFRLSHSHRAQRGIFGLE